MKSSTDFAECILESAQANLRSTIRRRLPAAGLTPTPAKTPIRFPIALPRRDLHIFVLFPGLLGLDHWCCGSAGAAEAFVYAAQVFDRKDLLEKARTTLDQTVRRALKTTYYRFSPHVGQNYCFQPSLFRGLAGLGYTLIRTLEPRSLPCIMAFEL
jgi:hypothetical protein